MQFYICVPVMMASMFLLYTHTEASQAQKLVPANPSHPGKCYDEDTNAAYAVGETWGKPGSCQEYKCHTGPENKFLIQITGCSPIAAEPPCRVVSGNSNDPYPKCCQTVVCN